VVHAFDENDSAGLIAQIQPGDEVICRFQEGEVPCTLQEQQRSHRSEKADRHIEQELLSNIDRVRKSRLDGKGAHTDFDEIFDSRLTDHEKRNGRLLRLHES